MVALCVCAPLRRPGRRNCGDGPGPKEAGVRRLPTLCVVCIMERQFYVYILTNRAYGTLYVGITNDLIRRVWEHKNGFVDAFTKEHGLHRLVWYEIHATAYEAIRREKAIKKWRRDWKVNHIQAMNPAWDDLYAAIAA